MEQTLAQAAASIPESIDDVLPVGRPCASVEILLARAEHTIRRKGSLLGGRKADYEAEMRTLEARCAANWRQLRNEFVLQESMSLSKLTRARLRQYSPPELTEQADACARIEALASESLADPDSERELQQPLSAAQTEPVAPGFATLQRGR